MNLLFDDYGAYQGTWRGWKWGGTTAWFARAPLPPDVIAPSPLDRIEPNMRKIVDCDPVKIGELVLFGPPIQASGYPCRRVNDEYFANREIIEHIESRVGGGQWVFTRPLGKERPIPVLVLLREGEVHGALAPIRDNG